MRCSSESVTRRKNADRGGRPVDDEYRDRMTEYDTSGDNDPATTGAEFDARDRLAGQYDHIPLRVIGA